MSAIKIIQTSGNFKNIFLSIYITSQRVYRNLEPQRAKHGGPCKYPELKLMSSRFVHEPLRHPFTTFKVLWCLECWVIDKLSVWETSGSFPG